ncbi:hypothetical protein [Litorivivens sp.]|uniref:hypothetical protein n=1 Tax=Litorivivens sp. TaxID=2020868 RepID=UPI003567932D
MLKKILVSGVVAGALVGCTDSGDVNLSPTTISNGSGSGTGGGAGSNVCASYTESGQTFQGNFDGQDCVYGALFVSDSKPITVSSITFSNFGGKHIFEDSLFIGADVNATAAQSGKRIPQEGEGTRLNIAAGVTMVFKQPDSYVRIARGSQIFAEGTANSPIVFTADEDAMLGTATESDRGLWGGVQINGNGRTNKCHDGSPTGSGAPSTVSDFAATANNVHNCHVTAEGRPATYGGNNNAENSGVLKYVVIKHAGFEVVDGDELNALTLNAVGSGTTISHVQTYTSQDDGFEMFGGAVNMDHIVAVNVGDDSIDYSEGYNGDIQYAVVVHTSGANRCIEGDNTGGSRSDAFTPTTKLRISNLTCVTSNIDENAGTNVSAKGDSEGPLFREGAFFEMYNSLVTSYATSLASNECLELDDSEGPETIDAAQAGISKASSNVIACGEATKVGADAANTGFDLVNWLAGGGANAATPANTNTNNVLITGSDVAASAIGSVLVDSSQERDYLTGSAIKNGAGTTVFDQSSQLFDVSSLGSIFKKPTYLGGANASDDWLTGWAVGFDKPLTP